MFLHRTWIACFVLSAFVSAASAEQLTNRRVAEEGGIAADWKLAEGHPLVAPPYPAEYDSEDRPDVCLALQYTIYPDGTTGDFQVLRRWKSGAPANGVLNPFWLRFARAGVSAVGQWRFEPRVPENARPVTTIATLSFYGSTVADARELRAHCKVANLGAAIRALERRDTLLRMHVELEDQLRNAAYQTKVLTGDPH
jgi:hypothetical protein